MNRVLVATRGEMARRLIRFFRERDIETVSVFSEPDLEAPWVEEADYEVYLGGASVGETYMNPGRVLGAALDSGSDAVHPGYNFLAERPEFIDMAVRSNVPVLGVDPKALLRVQDRMGLRSAAASLGIPLIPASDLIPPTEDGIAEGAQLGFPLFVKSVSAGIFKVAHNEKELASAVESVRKWGTQLEGDTRVYLERAVDKLRHVGTVVVRDHHGTTAFLGHTDGSIKADYMTWVEEMGTEVVSPELSERLGNAAIALAQHLDWAGVGRVSWAVTSDGGWYLLGFSGRLTTGYNLVEEVYGVDLLDTQFRLSHGEHLDWEGMSNEPNRFGVQLRILHVDTTDMSRPEGMIEALDLPEGVIADVSLDVGFECSRQTEPLLVKLTVTGPTRQAALVQARSALEGLNIEGVPTNKDLLLALLGEEPYWRGNYDTSTLPGLLDRQ